MPRGRFERWSWQMPFAALISQCSQFQWLTANVPLVAPVKRVENQCSPWLVSRNSALVHWPRTGIQTALQQPDFFMSPWFSVVPALWHTCVMTVSVSTLLTGRYGRNCLYLNWLRNKSLAKRSFWKVVLADSCRSCCLAMTSILVTYCKCVTKSACQEGRKSVLSLIDFRKFRACPLIMATQVSLFRIHVAVPRSEMPAR